MTCVAIAFNTQDVDALTFGLIVCECLFITAHVVGLPGGFEYGKL